MALTKIEWTASIRPDGTVDPGYTFNPWRGCTKVHTGCANCYAERGAKRNPGTLGIWGDHGTRVVASEDMWKQPIKWDAAAAKSGVRKRVFCSSLADVFEDWRGWVLDAAGAVVWWCNDCRIFRKIGDSSHGACCGKCGSGNGRQATLDDVRERLFSLIDLTPNLDWLLVTKRPENIPQMMPTRRENVWLLTSVSDQATADRMIPELLKCRDLAPVLGVSAEPLVEPIRLDQVQWEGICEINTLTGTHGVYRPLQGKGPHLDWVIVGGESGPKARRCERQWVGSIVNQCRTASVPCFVKQMGSFIVDRNDQAGGWEPKHWPESVDSIEHHINGFREDYQGADARYRLVDPKGGDPAEWPPVLRVRQFPNVTGVTR